MSVIILFIKVYNLLVTDIIRKTHFLTTRRNFNTFLKKFNLLSYLKG